MQSKKKRSNIERLIISDITLAEMIPAELAAIPVTRYVVLNKISESFTGNSISMHAAAASLNSASIIIPITALAITFPIIYGIESKLFDKVYVPAAKKLYSMLRRDKEEER